MSFAEPRLLWLALLAPLAAVVAVGLWRRRLATDAAWASRGLWDRLLATYKPRRMTFSIAALTLAVLGTALALARPRWGEGEQKVERKGVDVVYLVDSSLSMGARDVIPSRLAAAKVLIRRLSEAMPGNRMGLVQTEGTGVVLAPLTVDGAVIDLLLDTVEPGSMPTPGTELAPGIDAALKLFGEGREKHRALVLLSDGEDFGGGLAAAADRLKDEGVVVYAFGIGSPGGSPVPVPGSGQNKLDENGKLVHSRLNEDTLESLTRATGGLYLRVTSAGTDPAPVVRRIEGMEKTTLESDTVNTREERFQWPVAAAVLALLLYLSVSPFAPFAQKTSRGAA